MLVNPTAIHCCHQPELEDLKLYSGSQVFKLLKGKEDKSR